MGIFTISLPVKIISWSIAFTISFLNFQLVYDEITNWIRELQNSWLSFALSTGGIGLLILLLLTTLYPILKRKKKVNMEVHPPFQASLPQSKTTSSFERIALALDYSPSDQLVIAYALRLASLKTHFILIHVAESASSRMMEEDTDDYEKRHDQQRMDKYLTFFKENGHEATFEVGDAKRVKFIAKVCKEHRADLLIVGSHGHRGIKDFIYGETVNQLRHKVNIPVFIAQ